MKYKAIVLDDDDQVRRLIVEQLRSRDFDVQGYGDAESLLAEVFDAGLPIQELPDLVVVDGQLGCRACDSSMNWPKEMHLAKSYSYLGA